MLGLDTEIEVAGSPEPCAEWVQNTEKSEPPSKIRNAIAKGTCMGIGAKSCGKPQYKQATRNPDLKH